MKMIHRPSIARLFKLKISLGMFTLDTGNCGNRR